MQKIKLILFLLIIIFLGSCANMHYKEGNRFYDNLGYGKAIESYQKALARKDITDAKRKLAFSYKKLGNYKKAEEWLTRVISEPEATEEDKIAYGLLLALNGKCSEATNYLKEFLKTYPANQQANLIIESCAAQPALMADSALFTVTQLTLNSKGSDFSPLYYKNGFIFVSEGSEKEKKQISEYTGRPYLDLYYIETDNQNNLKQPELLKGEINSKVHEGPAAISADGNMIYFTRNNYIKKKAKTSDEGVVNLKIYQAQMVEGEWKFVKPLSFTSDEFSTGHPTLSSDGKSMYFISDKPGGYGETDLYVSKLIDNNWSEPENLGLNFNTVGKEMFPYLFQDSILYFASDGKLGMGGLDIYYSKLEDGKWSAPVNVGYPVNSTADDFGYITDTTMQQGYFSSNRNSDGGIDNIFHYVKAIPLITLNGIVVDKETQEPLPGAMIELLKLNPNEKENYVTGADGTFSFQIVPKSEYKISASKENYFTISRNVDANKKDSNGHLYEKFELERIIIDKPIVLENIYYDFDKWNIRPDAAAELDKFAAFLLDNPRISVELSSHTDSRGTTNYNQTLSQKRAESAVEYLITKGVPKDRITAKGYGESMLVNKCADNVPCSAEEHQQNRRTEFKVTGYMAGGTEITSSSETKTFTPPIKENESNLNSVRDQKINNSDIYFTVQIGAVAKNSSSNSSRFDEVTDVRKVEGNDNYTRYFVGKTSSFAEAQTIRKQIVSKGFNDAFITAYYKGNKISVKEAQDLLKK